jgi:hypothetical protein
LLRRIFRPKRDEVMEEWRRLHNEEINDLYSSPSIVRVMKWRRMRQAGYVARMGESRGVYMRERDHLGYPGVGGKITLRWIFRKLDVVVRTGSSWLRIGTCGGHL